MSFFSTGAAGGFVFGGGARILNMTVLAASLAVKDFRRVGLRGTRTGLLPGTADGKSTAPFKLAEVFLRSKRGDVGPVGEGHHNAS